MSDNNNVYPRFPSIVCIETVNFCNCRCIFCPLFQGNDQMNRAMRPRATMDMGLFAKIIDDISSWENKPSGIFLNMDGEPLMDKDLPRRLISMKEKGISKLVTLQTNAEFMTEAVSEAIIDSSVGCVTIGFDGASKEIYEKHRVGCHYERVLENIASFIKLRKQAKGSTKIAIQYVRTKLNAHEVGQAYEMFAQILDHSLDFFCDTISRRWGGSHADYKDIILESEAGETFLISCPSVNEQMVILVNGLIAACCWDYNLTVFNGPLGNAGEETLPEIWNGARFNMLRQILRTNDTASRPKKCLSCIKSYPRTKPVLKDAVISCKELAEVASEGGYVYAFRQEF